MKKSIVFWIVIFALSALIFYSKLALSVKAKGIVVSAEWALKDKDNRMESFAKYIISCSSFYDHIFPRGCIETNTSGEIKNVIINAQNNQVSEMFKWE
jgi:hypothetical protein